MTIPNPPEKKSLPRLPRLVMLLVIATVVIVVDQIVKAWVVNTLELYQPTDIFPWLKPILSFTYIRNTGVAFGLFQGLGKWFRYFSLIVVVLVIVYQRTIPYEYFWMHFSLGLVTGGALGNAIDRFTLGFVVDFLDANLWPFADFAIFNVADSAITIGTAILLIDTLLTPVEEPDTGQDAAQGDDLAGSDAPSEVNDAQADI